MNSAVGMPGAAQGLGQPVVAEQVGPRQALALREDEHVQPRRPGDVGGVIGQIDPTHQTAADLMVDRVVDGIGAEPATHHRLPPVRPDHLPRAHLEVLTVALGRDLQSRPAHALEARDSRRT